MFKVFLCVAIAFLCSISTDAHSISCGKSTSVWCRIITSLDLQTEPHDELVIENSDHRENVTHFQWIDRSTLKSFPTGIFKTFPHLRVLDVTTGINRLKTSDFENAGNLEYLYLKNNDIPKLTEGLFTKTPKIVTIHIDRNEINEIDDFTFKGLNQLEEINLEFNYITALNKRTFAGAPNLKTILLMRNDIADIEDGTFDMEHLEHLDFEGNRLATIADTLFQNAPVLASIDIMDNHFYEVPRAVLTSPSLNSLILGGNELDTIDFTDFAHMPKLEYLSLETSGIKLTQARPIAPEHEAALSEIDLTDNILSNADILQQLSIFKKLTIIRLDENDFTKIDGIENIRDLLPNIEDVSIDRNEKIDCNWLRSVRQSVRNNNFTLYDTDNVEDGSHQDDKICGNNN